jgi:hypothetical protein
MRAARCVPRRRPVVLFSTHPNPLAPELVEAR